MMWWTRLVSALIRHFLECSAVWWMVPPHVPFFWLSIWIIVEWALDSHSDLSHSGWRTGFCPRMWYHWHKMVLYASLHFLVLSVFAHLQEKIECNETHVTHGSCLFCCFYISNDMDVVHHLAWRALPALPVSVGSHSNSLLAVFQWPANIILQSDTWGLVFHPIQTSLWWHVTQLELFGTWLRCHHLGCTFQSWPSEQMFQAGLVSIGSMSWNAGCMNFLQWFQ